MSLVFYGPGRCEHRFPRVSGDEPTMDGVLPSSEWFSPRERG